MQLHEQETQKARNIKLLRYLRIPFMVFLVLTLGVIFNTQSKADDHQIDVSWQTDIQRTHQQLTKAYIENARMCEVCKSKIYKYKEHMRDDIYAKKTLQTYEKRLKRYCDPLAASQKEPQTNE